MKHKTVTTDSVSDIQDNINWAVFLFADTPDCRLVEADGTG